MRRDMRRSTPERPCPFKAGDRIQAVANFRYHSYSPDQIYIVEDVDPMDSTLRARSATGSKGNWIKWDDCRPATGIGWDWLKGHLPAETLELLAAFEGLERLRLREDVALALVAKLPSLKAGILDCVEKLEHESAAS